MVFFFTLHIHHHKQEAVAILSLLLDTGYWTIIRLKHQCLWWPRKGKLALKASI